MRPRAGARRGRAARGGAWGVAGAHATPKRRALSPRLLLVGVLVLAAHLAVLGGDFSVFEAREAEARLETRRAEIRAVRQEVDSLRAHIQALRSSDEALERFARERYGLIRDGELLYRISDPAEAEPEEAEPAPVEASEPSVVGGRRGGEGLSGSR